MKRLASGGRIDREHPIKITFDGQELDAFKGDTLGSALLANGVALVGRSFKYHRPRGVYTAGLEEPNALVHLGKGARQEPNARATVVEAEAGLTAESQNAWPSRSFDLLAINDLLSPFLSAGFYYKTFIGPFKHSTKFWMMCETFIRRAAGMGRGGYEPDPDKYEKRHAFCDILIVGGGVAGLTAALSAGRAGAKVILVEQDIALGGDILASPSGQAHDDWLADALVELRAMSNVQILTRTTAIGAYDGDTYALIERVSDSSLAPQASQVRQRYWQFHAHRSILATGAIERPMVFGGNDRPGVMLANAARTYLHRYAVCCGDRAVVFTNNNSAYSVATELAAASRQVTLVDLRTDVDPDILKQAKNAGVSVMLGHAVLEAHGRSKVTSASIVKVDAKGRATGPSQKLACDLIATSAGWSPSVHLWSQLYRKPVFNEAAACFVPESNPDHAMQAVGTAMAAGDLSEIIDQSFACGAKMAEQTGATRDVGLPPAAFETGPFWQRSIQPTFAVFKANGKTKGKAFVDFQHDVKISDIDQAHLEGYVSVEHLKRYTTLGMATDQGKLSNVNALSRMAELRDQPISEVGTTTFRPPFVPVAIGAIVGHEHGHHFRPTRLSPMHHWHLRSGAKMTEAGAWMRPWYYPEAEETLASAYKREAHHVRHHVGIVDVSTLGKIAVQGPDAAEFLNRMYVNGWKSLPVGRLRYGVMLREDGFVLDDGATARLGENDYFMTTTTANAAKVLAQSELLLQTAWRDLKVHVTTVTDQWAAMAVAGPKSRELLTKVSGADLSKDVLPNNHFTTATIDGVEVRIHRMSYSGELAYEVYIPAGYGQHVWQTIYEAGQEFNLRPYGTEAMGTLRIEKGHVAGAEIEGRTTLKDLGLERFASSKKPFVGSVLRKRPVLEDPERPTLVGFEVDGESGVKPGSLVFQQNAEPKGHGEGWISSTTYSPALGKNIALGLLKNGRDRKGETVKIVNFVGNDASTAKVVSPHHFDPEGVRQNG